MRILSPVDDSNKGQLTPLTDVKNSIFLAGPCPREDYNDDWRFDAFKILKELGFNGTVITPTNPNYASVNLKKQTSWEYEAMHKASCIVFWIPRSEEHPAYTTNLELGQWWTKDGVHVGFPNGSIKNEYIGVRMEMMNKPVHKTLRSTLKAAVEDLTREGDVFFTSDTHFSQQRTLDLSRRPFRDLSDMDLTFISNWNKKIRMNDKVFHLGDFGESFEYLNLLNYNELYLMEGNYERKQYGETLKDVLKDYKKVKLIKNHTKFVFDEKDEFVLQHEPINPEVVSDLSKANIAAPENINDFYLYGHIHNKSNYKRNGIEVGIDCYGTYTPISLEEVKWRRDAVLKYVDENVFTEKCI